MMTIKEAAKMYGDSLRRTIDSMQGSDDVIDATGTPVPARIEAKGTGVGSRTVHPAPKSEDLA